MQKQSGHRTVPCPIHTGHDGTAWNSYHMHIGSARVHIAILKVAYDWLKARGIGNG